MAEFRTTSQAGASLTRCLRATASAVMGKMELLRKGEGGSNLVETALVLPLYFLLVFTLISFSFVLFAYANATYAGKLAVRYASVHSAASITPCTSAQITALITPYLFGAPSTVKITPTWGPSNVVGATFSVTVTLTYGTGMSYGYLNNLVASTTASGIIVH